VSTVSPVSWARSSIRQRSVMRSLLEGDGPGRGLEQGCVLGNTLETVYV